MWVGRGVKHGGSGSEDSLPDPELEEKMACRMGICLPPPPSFPLSASQQLPISSPDTPTTQPSQHRPASGLEGDCQSCRSNQEGDASGQGVLYLLPGFFGPLLPSPHPRAGKK